MPLTGTRPHGPQVEVQLVQAGIEFAATAKAKRLHVFTESAEKLFQRCGFEILERTKLQDVPITVLVLTLS